MFTDFRSAGVGFLVVSSGLGLAVLGNPSIAQVYNDFDWGYPHQQDQGEPNGHYDSAYDVYSDLGYYDGYDFGYGYNDEIYDYGDAFRDGRLREKYFYDPYDLDPGFDYGSLNPRYDPDYGYDYDYYGDWYGDFYGEYF